MGGRSPTEPVGWSDEAQPEERSPEVMAGRRPTKAEPEGRGSRVTVEARELGAEAEVRDTPAPETLEDGRPAGLAPYR